jgi:hypothetical protein
MTVLIIIAKEPMAALLFQPVVKIQIVLSFLNGKTNQVI